MPTVHEAFTPGDHGQPAGKMKMSLRATATEAAATLLEGACFSWPGLSSPRRGGDLGLANLGTSSNVLAVR
jgi:hypothetical protein